MAVSGTATVLVVTEKVVEELPPGTTTFSGTVASTAESKIVVPPGGASPLSLTVTVTGLLPTTEVGLAVTLVNVAGVIVKVEFWLAPPSVATIVDDTELDSPNVVTVNVALDAPAATVTLAGTVAPLPEELRFTVVPPGPAGPFKIIEPVDEFPPTTELGERNRFPKVAGTTVRIADLVDPASAALIVTADDAETAMVWTVNVAEVAPLLTVIVAGTMTPAPFEDIFKVAVLASTGDAKVTVPVVLLPPVKVEDESVTDVTGG